MKFLVDAQLPKVLAEFLRGKGYAAIHTLDLPDKNRTTDKQIIEIAVQEDCIVITKDDDFLESHFINNMPGKLVLVKPEIYQTQSFLKFFLSTFWK